MHIANAPKYKQAAGAMQGPQSFGGRHGARSTIAQCCRLPVCAVAQFLPWPKQALGPGIPNANVGTRKEIDEKVGGDPALAASMSSAKILPALSFTLEALSHSAYGSRTLLQSVSAPCTLASSQTSLPMSSRLRP